MLRKTAIDGLFDSVTPYGYGGVLFDGEIFAFRKKEFWKAYIENMHELNIVDNFVRYHPVLANAVSMREVSDVIDLGKTVAMSLVSPEQIWDDFTSKNRNMIRKAEKNGIVIRHGKGMPLFDEFIRIYMLLWKRIMRRSTIF